MYNVYAARVVFIDCAEKRRRIRVRVESIINNERRNERRENKKRVYTHVRVIAGAVCALSEFRETISCVLLLLQRFLRYTCACILIRAALL